MRTWFQQLDRIENKLNRLDNKVDQILNKESTVMATLDDLGNYRLDVA